MSTQLDQNQIIQKVFNETNDSLNVTVGATVNVDTGIVEVAIDQTSDSIKIGDGTNLVSTTNDGGTRGFNTHLTNLTLPLPTGASTSALQTTANTSLNSIDSKIPSNLTVEDNRLLVNANTDAVWIVSQFLNGSSKNMDVDGSVTPVDFSYSPTSGKIYIKQISFFIADNGITPPDKFGKITALTNGLVLEVQTKGNVYQICNIKDNADLVNIFSNEPLIPGSNSGFLDNNDSYSGNLLFDMPIVLDTSMSDYIKFIVQDDLSGIDFLQANLKYRINV